MSEHLFLGDSTYPHQSLVSELRNFGATIAELRAADRIEQLERDLAVAQKGHARYEYMRKLTPHSFNILWSKNLHGYTPFDDLIDAAISEVKK